MSLHLGTAVGADDGNDGDGGDGGDDGDDGENGCWGVGNALTGGTEEDIWGGTKALECFFVPSVCPPVVEGGA